MYIVTVLFTVRGANYGDFMAAMLRNAADSLATEPECLQFDVCERLGDADSPGQKSVFLYEVYASQDAFTAHLTLPHFLHFNASTAHLVINKTVQVFTRREVTAAVQ